MKVSLIPIFALLFIGLLAFSNENPIFGQTANSTIYTVTGNENFLEVIANTEGKKQVILIPFDQLLFNLNLHYDENNNFKSMTMSLKPELQNFYNQVGFFGRPHDTVFIYPVFTQAAYNTNGFYDYYRKTCDESCLTVNIPSRIHGGYSASVAGAFVLRSLNYSYVTDIDVDKNPQILKQYKRVIVLHNEYVTQNEFDAITSHPDVIFLYPNALYAQVIVNYGTSQITLVRGHEYPDPSIRNGFGWKLDNSKFEYNVQCSNWNFYKKGNYTLLNCYPEFKIMHSPQLLRELQLKDPTSVIDDIANWLRYTNDANATEQLLADYDIQANQIPIWVQKPAIMFLNGYITSFRI